MNQYAFFAFVIAPAVVLALGWGAALLHVYLSRREEREPGE
jgi:hypothetical protein